MTVDKNEKEPKKEENVPSEPSCCALPTFEQFLNKELGQTIEKSSDSEASLPRDLGHSCCGPGAEHVHPHTKQIDDKTIKEHISKRYASMIEKKGASCCAPSDIDLTQVDGETKEKYVERLGYSKEELDSLPETVTDISFGCGNPTAIANLKPGEFVLDLGSGGGIDVFLAAQKVGESGKAIGVDMTIEMIERARRNAKELNLKNVEFKLGEIESLPIDDNSIDVIISNCVINLSPDKSQVFRETFRVLKPGGRLAVSDIVLGGTLPDFIQKNLDVWASCVAGALLEDDYLQRIRDAGFIDVKIESRAYAGDLISEEDLDIPLVKEAIEKYGIDLKAVQKLVSSIKVSAKKPS